MSRLSEYVCGPVVLVLWCLFVCLWFAGIIFGWPQLLLVLQDEGWYVRPTATKQVTHIHVCLPRPPLMWQVCRPVLARRGTALQSAVERP